MKRLILLLLILVLLFPTTVLADVSVDPIDTSIQFPEGRETAGVFLANGVIYQIGGENSNENPTQTIYSYDTNTKTVSVEDETLPIPLGYLCDSIVVKDGCAYIYGGMIDATRQHTAKIHKYDVAAGTVVALPETLSQPMAGVSAVLVGDTVWLFGGVISGNGVSLGLIQKHDLSTGVVTTIGTSLPVPAMFMSHAYDPINNVIYFYGGYYRTYEFNLELDTIVKFDIGTETCTVLPETLPTPRDSTTAFWYDGKGYIFGGYSEPPSTYYSDILVHDPETGLITLSDAVIPKPMDDFMAILSGSKGWLVPVALEGTPINDASYQKYIAEFSLGEEGIEMTATVINEIVSLSITSDPMPFGTLNPGDESATFMVTIENMGNVDTWIGASVEPTGTLMDYVLVDNMPVSSPDIVLLAPGQTVQLGVKLVVPFDYIPNGEERAKLQFSGTAQ